VQIVVLLSVKSHKRFPVDSRSKLASQGGRLGDDSGDPVDLLDASTSRALVRTAAGNAPEPEEEVDFTRNSLGKLVIREEEDPFSTKRRKRKKSDLDSDDSDLDLGIHGLSAAIRDTKGAASLKQVGKYAHSQHTAVTRKSRASVVSRGSQKSRDASHDRFKAKKASGDTQKGSVVEPFAYWRLDKNLLNSRKQKSRSAKSRLGHVVKSDTPARGQKAKKTRTK
jgi:hypothetical protein